MKHISWLKIILVEQNKTRELLAETFDNEATVPRWCTN